MNLTAAIHARLVGDVTLTALLSEYLGEPAVFTSDPAPGNAVLPYLVSAGQVTDRAFDTKNSRGRQVWRDVRCYAPASGSAALVETIAERVRVLLHRYAMEVDGHETWVSEASGPTGADEKDAYGRIVSLRLMLVEV